MCRYLCKLWTSLSFVIKILNLYILWKRFVLYTISGGFVGLGRAGFSSLQIFIGKDVMICCWEV